MREGMPCAVFGALLLSASACLGQVLTDRPSAMRVTTGAVNPALYAFPPRPTQAGWLHAVPSALLAPDQHPGISPFDWSRPMWHGATIAIGKPGSLSSSQQAAMTASGMRHVVLRLTARRHIEGHDRTEPQHDVLEGWLTHDSLAGWMVAPPTPDESWRWIVVILTTLGVGGTVGLIARLGAN